MREIILVTLFIVCMAPRLLFCQDKLEEGKNNYALARENYRSGHYNDALTFLLKAEPVLGDSSNLLSFKINILQKLDSINGSGRPELRNAIDKFIITVDKNKFPSNRYDEIVNISNNLDNEMKTEKADYEEARKTGTPESYNFFLSRYPNSKYASEIQSLYDQLPEMQEKSKLEKFNQVWKDKNLPLIQKYKSNFPWMVSAGLVFMAGGGTLGGFGVYSHLHPAQTVTNKWVVDPNTNVLQTTTTYANRNTVYMYSMLGSGGVLVITGVALVACGGSYNSKLIKLKNEADRNGITLTWMPTYVPGSKSPDVYLALKF